MLVQKIDSENGFDSKTPCSKQERNKLHEAEFASAFF